MTRLVCARCGALVATVRDARFGVLPTWSLCQRCSRPAYHRLRP